MNEPKVAIVGLTLTILFGVGVWLAIDAYVTDRFHYFVIGAGLQWIALNMLIMVRNWKP